MGIKLDIDPARLKSLRTRLGIPLHAGAKMTGYSEEQLRTWESESTALDVDTLQKLAKAYQRNWYVFLLEEEVGRPATPRDFRRMHGTSDELGYESLLAFDKAWLLLGKIESLNVTDEPFAKQHQAKLSDNPEDVAEAFRDRLGVQGQPATPDNYAVLRFWRDLLTSAGVYISQVKIPTDEVRAFCISRNEAHLVVLSNKDLPNPRVFSLLHEIGHLLLGSDAMCRPSAAFIGDGMSQEPWCNRFAAAVLMPQAELEANPKFHELIGGEIVLGSGRSLASDFGVSELALFRRLETFGIISGHKYRSLQKESEDKWKDRKEKPSTGFMEHHNKIIAKESPLFVRQVLNAHANGDLTYREIGTLLNTPLRSIPQIREAVG
jgi:Zn-dependent peptidase ImmA (M78 family)